MKERTKSLKNSWRSFHLLVIWAVNPLSIFITSFGFAGNKQIYPTTSRFPIFFYFCAQFSIKLFITSGFIDDNIFSWLYFYTSYHNFLYLHLYFLNAEYICQIEKFVMASPSFYFVNAHTLIQVKSSSTYQHFSLQTCFQIC